MSDAFGSLLQSRKFLVLLLDQGVSLILFIVGLAVPDWMENIKVLIAIMKPVAIMMIYAIAKEDAAEKGNPNPALYVPEDNDQ